MDGTSADLRAIHEAFIRDQVAINEATGGAATRRDGCWVTIHPQIPIEFFNAIWVDPSVEAPPAAALSAAVEETVAGGGPIFLLSIDEPSPALTDLAAEIGLARAFATPVMTCEPMRFVAPPPTEAEIEEVDAPGPAIAPIAGGYELPREVAASFMNDRLLAVPGLSTYVATAAGTPVSTATVVRHGDGVGVYAVATPPEARGRGYGAAVTAAGVTAAFAAGASIAYLQSSSMGYPVYARLGFVERWRYVAMCRG